MTIIGGKYGNLTGRTVDYFAPVASSGGEADPWGLDKGRALPPPGGAEEHRADSHPGRGILGIREVRSGFVEGSSRVSLEGAFLDALRRAEARQPPVVQVRLEDLRVRWGEGAREFRVVLSIEA